MYPPHLTLSALFLSCFRSTLLTKLLIELRRVKYTDRNRISAIRSEFQMTVSDLYLIGLRSVFPIFDQKLSILIHPSSRQSSLRESEFRSIIASNSILKFANLDL